MKNKEKIYLIGGIAYMFLYAISGALGYASLLSGNQAVWAWCIGILTVAVATNIGIIAVYLLLDHKERKEGGK